MAVLKILQAKAFPWDQKDVTDGDPPWKNDPLM
jgi:hypothetical protein